MEHGSATHPFLTALWQAPLLLGIVLGVCLAICAAVALTLRATADCSEFNKGHSPEQSINASNLDTPVFLFSLVAAAVLFASFWGFFSSTPGLSDLDEVAFSHRLRVRGALSLGAGVGTLALLAWLWTTMFKTMEAMTSQQPGADGKPGGSACVPGQDASSGISGRVASLRYFKFIIAAVGLSLVVLGLAFLRWEGHEKAAQSSHAGLFEEADADEFSRNEYAAAGDDISFEEHGHLHAEMPSGNAQHLGEPNAEAGSLGRMPSVGFNKPPAASVGAPRGQGLTAFQTASSPRRATQ